MGNRKGGNQPAVNQQDLHIDDLLMENFAEQVSSFSLKKKLVVVATAQRRGKAYIHCFIIVVVDTTI